MVNLYFIFYTIFLIYFSYISFCRYEINTANHVLFNGLALNDVEEVLPGRLFSTRMPRDINNAPSANDFKMKAIENKICSVLILAETKEYEKYAGADLEVFYKSLNLEVLHHPIADFSVPDQPAIVEDVKEILRRLSDGKNCLIHCAGGNGRTGMVIAAVVKCVGVKDPISWIRRVKSVYVETPEQASFVNTMPVVLDELIASKHPLLAKAIAAERLLHAMTYQAKSTTTVHADLATAPIELSDQQLADFSSTFELLDSHKTGNVSCADLVKLFKDLGAEISDIDKTVTKFISTVDVEGVLTKSDFIKLLTT